jgi:hypothetical protein
LNDTLMETLADNGNGNYAYVDDINEVQKIFVEDLTSTLQAITLFAVTCLSIRTGASPLSNYVVKIPTLVR